MNIWGIKRVMTVDGHVADFCLLCRDVRPFRIDRVGLARHAFGLPVGERRYLEHVAQCQACGSTIAPDLGRFSAMAPKPAALEALVDETHPDVRERYGQRLELEAVLAREPATLTPVLRNELIAEALVAVNHEVHLRTADMNFDRPVLVAAIAGLALAVGVVPALAADAPTRTLLELGVLGATTGAVAWLLATVDARFLRREIYPKLGASLRPLAPTEAELDANLKRLRQRKLKVGVAIRARTLLRWIARPPAPAPAPATPRFAQPARG